MDRDRAAVAAALGGVLLFLVASGDYRDYVRPGMGPYLLAASILLVASGALRLGRHAGHTGERFPPIAVLALLPVLVTTAVAPAPLGTSSVSASLGGRAPPIDTRSEFPPLPPARRGAVPLGVMDFITRAEYDTARSLRDVRVRLVGQVVPDARAAPDGFWLVRFAIYCCAADAIPLRVRVQGTLAVPPRDSWVEVTGTWRPAVVRRPGPFDPNVVVALDGDSVRVVDQPANPYDGTL